MGAVTRFIEPIYGNALNSTIMVSIIQLHPLWIHGYKKYKTVCESAQKIGNQNHYDKE